MPPDRPASALPPSDLTGVRPGDSKARIQPQVPTSAASGREPHDKASGIASNDMEQLFREHNEALLKFVSAKLGSTQEAKEIAQEAYVRLLRLNQPETVSCLRAFLFKTAANLATDRLRQRGRRKFMVTTHSFDFAVFDLSPDRQLEGEQAMQCLRAAIDELPAKCREAFLLYRLEGLSCSEVAARLGLQERMVWLYISRALEYVRARVAGDDRPCQQERKT